MHQHCKKSLIASGEPGSTNDVIRVAQLLNVNGALAASVFDNNVLTINNSNSPGCGYYVYF